MTDKIEYYLLLIFIVAPIVSGGLMVGACFVVQKLVSYISLGKRERTGIVFLMACDYKCSVSLTLTVRLVGLQCVIVSSPGHTHLFSIDQRYG